jgi:hypothetical protein
MAFKPNYNHQRAERNRTKEQRKHEKQQRRDDKVVQRKTAQDAPVAATDDATRTDPT